MATMGHYSVYVTLLQTPVGFCFSGYYHYTSAGMVITAKTKSNIKEAKV